MTRQSCRATVPVCDSGHNAQGGVPCYARLLVGFALFMGGESTPSRATQALMTQTAQTAVCNRHHSVEQQLCRLLLLSLDRSGGAQLTLSHELMADMLGVRREGITGAAGSQGRVRTARAGAGIAVRLAVGRSRQTPEPSVRRRTDSSVP